MNTQTNGEDTPTKNNFKIKVDNEVLVFDTNIVTGSQILLKANKIPVECFALYQKLKGCDFEKISTLETIDLSKEGIEKFTVKASEVFHYFLDDEPETTEQKTLTANQILDQGGITPVSDYYLMEIDNEGNEISHKNSPDKPITMKCPGSKFISIFRGSMPVS